MNEASRVGLWIAALAALLAAVLLPLMAHAQAGQPPCGTRAQADEGLSRAGMTRQGDPVAVGPRFFEFWRAPSGTWAIIVVLNAASGAEIVCLIESGRADPQAAK